MSLMSLQRGSGSAKSLATDSTAPQSNWNVDGLADCAQAHGTRHLELESAETCAQVLTCILGAPTSRTPRAPFESPLHPLALWVTPHVILSGYSTPLCRLLSLQFPGGSLGHWTFLGSPRPLVWRGASFSLIR